MSTLLAPRARSARATAPALAHLPWVRVAPDAPYFALEDGTPFTPVGANEAISWPELAPLFRGRDLDAVEAYLASLRAQGVTVLRLMLEYSQVRHRYFERPAGRFVPAMVRLWDDLFAICARVGLRILLTPFDTFFQWTHWRHHPYNRANGGPCAHRGEQLRCRDTREHVKRRLAFATERWGATGVIFAWDLWNELHPAHACDDHAALWDFVHETSDHLREVELRLHGRAHPQTVSVFGPELYRHESLRALIYRHPGLDFASPHLYAHGTIDDPRDTVAPAIAAGQLVRDGLAEIRDRRPFLDSEHGPIHSFKDRHVTLPDAFDDEYFRNIQWAHLASGGAGGGMRWPNRRPHSLTRRMRAAQRALAEFLPLVDWLAFDRRDLSEAVSVCDAASGAARRLARPALRRGRDGAPIVRLARTELATFACGDARQAVVFLFLLRTDAMTSDGRLRRDVAPLSLTLDVPGLAAGRYAVRDVDPVRGGVLRACEVAHDGGTLTIAPLPLAAERVVALRPA